MKKNFFYFAALCFAAMITAVAFTACSDDDDDSDNNGNNTPSKVKLQAIDLGLSVKWANMNVGASKPEGYGGYYAFGETEEKDVYNKSTYKYYQNGSYVNIGSDIGGTRYDVAHVKWGGKWRMPTFDEIKELVNKCTWKWTPSNGVNGYQITGPSGNSIFLPAAGCHDDATYRNAGSYGNYWCYFPNSSYTDNQYYLSFGSGNRNWYFTPRYYGFTVRPVAE